MNNLFLKRYQSVKPGRFVSDHPGAFPVFEVDDSGVSWMKHLDKRGRTAQLAAVAAAEAFEDARLTKSERQSKRIGVCLGTTVGNSMNNEVFYRSYLQKMQPDLFEMDRYFLSNPADVIAREFELNGPVMTVANACSSGTDAIGTGLSWLKMDLCDIVLVGGCDELSHVSYLGFASLLINSNKTCRPFDRNRNGLTLGEGAAVLVLEKESGRKAARCHVTSYATACDAYHLTAPDPAGTGLRNALHESLASCDPAELAFINAHGTGTIDNDKVEMTVLDEMFPKTPYFSTKGCTGHTLGAAGAIGAAVTIGCLERREIPASAGFSKIPEGFSRGPTENVQTISGRYGLSQSLAFGGNNSVVVFRKNES